MIRIVALMLKIQKQRDKDHRDRILMLLSIEVSKVRISRSTILILKSIEEADRPL
jgi:peptide subunit release factor RF-3